MGEILNGQTGATVEPTVTAGTRGTRTRKAEAVKAEGPVELRKARKAPVGHVIHGYPGRVTYKPARQYQSSTFPECIEFEGGYAEACVKSSRRSAPAHSASVTGEEMVEFLRDVILLPEKAIANRDRGAIEKALEAYSVRLAAVTLEKGREVTFEFAPVVRTRKGRAGKAAKPSLPAEKAARLAR
jgi:hypothetical protein